MRSPTGDGTGWIRTLAELICLPEPTRITHLIRIKEVIDQIHWDPTRQAALRRLHEFLPHAGDYAGMRNFDFGPANRSNVSGLSPYVTTRLISEQEMIQSTLREYPAGQVEKFLQEVLWRTYWKGWLEMRPDVWDRWVNESRAANESVDSDLLGRAESGSTGIDCFDTWVRELRECGWLHNHARMWFASIWIFTLGLPWQLGARFFFRHLLDADAASNTLSWRWVAGLHTRGKHYVARADNIRKFTNDRFNPAGQLREDAGPLPPDDEVPIQNLKLPDVRPHGRFGLLVHGDDTTIDLELNDQPAAVAWISPAAGTKNADWSEMVLNFRTNAVRNSAQRIGDASACDVIEITTAEALTAWVAQEKLETMAIAHLPVGPWRDGLDGWFDNVPMVRVVRPWDRKLWPHATHGFFRFKSQLPAVVRECAP